MQQSRAIHSLLNLGGKRANQQRFQPIELKLGQNGGLQILQQQNNNDQSMFSMIKGQHRPKVMICVTMYSEPVQELEKTLNGICQSMQSFYNIGISPSHIVVIVMFDGLLQINNDSEDNNYHNNVVTMTRNIDKKLQIQQDKTLDEQHKQYLINSQRIKEYNPEQIEYLRQNKQQLLAKYQNNRESLLRTLQSIKGNIIQNIDEYIEQNIVDAMEKEYQIGLQYVNDRKNRAWTYQYVLQTNMRINNLNAKQYSPILYSFKFANGSKLSSHLWFFKGFCQEFQPEYCVLLDGGAYPQKDSIYKLILSMMSDRQIGGVCGTMGIEQTQVKEAQNKKLDMISDGISQMFSIEKCQSCEYDLAHIFDKQAEAVSNFIHVLPGAFSAYRYKAFTEKFDNHNNNNEESVNINNNNNDILEEYLKSVINQDFEFQTLNEANMYLAEDRVLCSKLFYQGYYLKYIADAYVLVDACSTLRKLLFQRRRWINGSWFALTYVIDNFRKGLKDSGHGDCSKIWFYFSMVQASIQQGMIYFMETFQILWIYMILYSLIDLGNGDLNSLVISILLALYIGLVFCMIYLSLQYDPNLIKQVNENQDNETEYYLGNLQRISTILGIISLATFGYTIYLLINEIFLQYSFNDFINKPDVPQSYYILLVVISIGMMILPAILSIINSCKDNVQTLQRILYSLVSYIFYQPTYAHLFVIYSFCRIDDLSWGTKGLIIDQTNNNNTQSDKAYQKYKFICKWIIYNTIASGTILILFQINLFLFIQCFILAVSVFLTLLSIMKGLFSIVYIFKFYYIKQQMNTVESQLRDNQLQENNQNQDWLNILINPIQQNNQIPQ